MSKQTNDEVSQSKSKSASALIGAVVFVVGLAVALYLVFAPVEEQMGGGRERPPPPVLVEQVLRESIPFQLESLGTVRANEQATLSAKVTDQVVGIFYTDGQLVKKGEILVQLDDAEQQALLAEAESLLAERERQVERILKVEGTGALSKSLIDEERSRLTRARAGVDLIEAAIADRTILAPFDGQVGLRDVSEGELITPGKTLAVISDLTPVKVDFTAPERYIGEIESGLQIEAYSVAYPGRLFTGEIVSVSPIVDRVTRAAQVRAIIPNEDLALRPGMLLKIQIILGEAETLTVNESALIPIGEKQFAYQVIDGKAERKELVIGRRFPGKVEVLEGLDAGDPVITEGFRARPGMPVQVTTEEAVYTVEREEG